MQSLKYQGGAKEEYTYWNDGQLKKLVNLKTDGTTKIDEYKYQYNAAHNQIRKTDNKGNTIYDYDELNRLKTVTEPSGRYTVYEYDAAGNGEKETVTVGSEVTTKIYEYNELDWLTGIKVNNVPVASYSYDNNGNMTAADQSSDMFYEYDLFNRMIAIRDENNSTIMDCTYNGEGYRVGKTSSGTTTKYLYEYSEVVLEVDGSNDTKARNVYGTNLVNRTLDTSTLYYMYNGHGDVTALISQTGVVSGTYYYDAFGNILERTGNVDNSITYAGYQYDKETEVRDANGNVIETGLYYLNSRMYDPKVARFLQEDTVKGDINDPLSLNLYAYCHNRPLIYIDPTGETPIKKLITDAGGSLKWDGESKIADAVVNGNDYSFQVNSNGTINLIKDGLKYGTFKTSEAKLVDNSYIDIEDNVFGRYFGFYGLNKPVPGPAKQPLYNTIYNSKTESKLSGEAKMHIWNLDNLYGNLLNNDVPKAEAELTRNLVSGGTNAVV